MDRTKNSAETGPEQNRLKEYRDVRRTKEQVVDYLSKHDRLRPRSSTKELENKWGVKAAPVAVAPLLAVAPAAAAAPAAEAKTEFTVVLTRRGDKKINVIKEVRAVTGLGLKEAKDLVEGAPKTVKDGVNKAEADEIKKKLRGRRKVEIK